MIILRSVLLRQSKPIVFSRPNSFFNQRILPAANLALLTWYRNHWSPNEPIDKLLEDGSAPTWSTVRARYWKKRYEQAKYTGEFDLCNLKRMQIGLAPQEYSFMTYKLESKELHHIIPKRYQGSNAAANLLEVTPDEHAAVDSYRKRKYKAN